MITAELISIGDELLIGQTINTNAAWLGQQLALIGIKVKNVTTISDDENAIITAFDVAIQRNQIVLVTGGLGPTKDDITKHTLCRYFNTTLIRNEEVLQHVQQFFLQRNRPMLAVNTMQADLPAICKVLANKVGTAAGMLFETETGILVSMPGVPYEMKAIFTSELLPEITSRFQTPNLYHRTVLTQGIGESFLADQLTDWENRLAEAGISLAYLPSPGMVKLRLTSYIGEQDATIIGEFVSELKAQFPRNCFGEEEDFLPVVVGRILEEKKFTIGTVESCTGGAIAQSLTAISGASNYFEGALITYSIAQKNNLAHVEKGIIEQFGVVSEEVATAMALGGRTALNTDYCIATTGIAGPTGGTDTCPVGTIWIAIAGKCGVVAKKCNFGDNRERNIQMTVLSALNLLRCELLEINQ
jgi:nicotinamide-nucleotide amidase